MPSSWPVCIGQRTESSDWSHNQPIPSDTAFLLLADFTLIREEPKKCSMSSVMGYKVARGYSSATQFPHRNSGGMQVSAAGIPMTVSRR